MSARFHRFYLSDKEVEGFCRRLSYFEDPPVRDSIVPKPFYAHEKLHSAAFARVYGHDFSSGSDPWQNLKYLEDRANFKSWLYYKLKMRLALVLTSLDQYRAELDDLYLRFEDFEEDGEQRNADALVAGLKRYFSFVDRADEIRRKHHDAAPRLDRKFIGDGDSEVLSELQALKEEFGLPEKATILDEIAGTYFWFTPLRKRFGEQKLREVSGATPAESRKKLWSLLDSLDKELEQTSAAFERALLQNVYAFDWDKLRELANHVMATIYPANAEMNEVLAEFAKRLFVEDHGRPISEYIDAAALCLGMLSLILFTGGAGATVLAVFVDVLGAALAISSQVSKSFEEVDSDLYNRGANINRALAVAPKSEIDAWDLAFAVFTIGAAAKWGRIAKLSRKPKSEALSDLGKRVDNFDEALPGNPKKGSLPTEEVADAKPAAQRSADGKDQAEAARLSALADGRPRGPERAAPPRHGKPNESAFVPEFPENDYLAHAYDQLYESLTTAIKGERQRTGAKKAKEELLQKIKTALDNTTRAAEADNPMMAIARKSLDDLLASRLGSKTTAAEVLAALRGDGEILKSLRKFREIIKPQRDLSVGELLEPGVLARFGFEAFGKKFRAFDGFRIEGTRVILSQIKSTMLPLREAVKLDDRWRRRIFRDAMDDFVDKLEKVAATKGTSNYAEALSDLRAKFPGARFADDATELADVELHVLVVVREMPDDAEAIRAAFEKLRDLKYGKVQPRLTLITEDEVARLIRQNVDDSLSPRTKIPVRNLPGAAP